MNNLTKSLAAAALVLLSAACAKEQVAAPEEGEVLVTFTVANPALSTKAIGDGNTVDKVSCNVYTSDGATRYSTLSKVVDMTGGKATFTVALAAGQTYDFCFWAYKDGQSAYTFDPDAKTVKVNYEGAQANDETRDAFYWYENDLKVAGSLNKTITLYRPFAQVNLGTTAEDIEAAKTAGIEVNTSAISFSNVYTDLNLVDGTVTGSTTADFAAAALPTEKLTVNQKEYAGTYEYLAMAYILIGKDQKDVTDATFTLATTKDPVEVKTTFMDVRGNWRTNVLGCPTLLSAEATFNIVVDPAFDGEYVHPDTDLEKLQFAAANGGVVTLSEDVLLDETLVVNKAMTLDLNGHTISSTADLWNTDGKNNWSVISVRESGNLTIKGEGGVKAKANDAYGIDVQSEDASLTIEGGEYLGNITAVYVFAGSATINGGTYGIQQLNTNNVEDSWGLTVNLYNQNQDAGKAKLTITGGTFYKYDPSHATDGNHDGNLVAAGYSVVKDGDNYTVVEGTAVTTEAELAQALNAGGTVVLGADIELDKALVVAEGKTVVLNLNGKTIKNTKTGDESNGAIKSFGDCLTINGEGSVICEDGYAVASFSENGGKVVINGGTFVGNNGSCIYSWDGAVEIYGGTFSAPGSENNNHHPGWYYVLNMSNKSTAPITVYGGTFVNYDPSKGDDALGGTFVATGYKSVDNGDGTYTVVAE